VAPLGAGTSTLTYTYDAAGRRTQMQVTGQTAVTYGYDAAGRRTSMGGSYARVNLIRALRGWPTCGARSAQTSTSR
jgi:hypothetical protein